MGSFCRIFYEWVLLSSTRKRRRKHHESNQICFNVFSWVFIIQRHFAHPVVYIVVDNRFSQLYCWCVFSLVIFLRFFPAWTFGCEVRVESFQIEFPKNKWTRDSDKRKSAVPIALAFLQTYCKLKLYFTGTWLIVFDENVLCVCPLLHCNISILAANKKIIGLEAN